uniref:Uncharacterized protein n=1 Tax=Rhizophagus irregularis (strain DAOM 181602 / DAOM 197198 / MUCL 43194) TaxID=747089 RepID=U9THY6_RHIID
MQLPKLETINTEILGSGTNAVQTLSVKEAYLWLDQLVGSVPAKIGPVSVLGPVFTV